ncbi:MAG: adenosylcobinamide-GDP ribazoletransferase [Burkholderiales bacterium]|nr:adenosylcobinamide-GDP ribazoletransferase [Burkholderiales bacterium]
MGIELQMFLIALRVGTRLPLPDWAAAHPGWLASSRRHDPAVGLLVGAFAAGVLFLAGHALPAGVAVLVAVAASVWFTRGRDEAGLARCCEAWAGLSAGGARAGPSAGGAASGAGPIGATALMLVLALRAAALYALATRDLGLTLAVLPLAQAWPRVAALLARQWDAPERGDTGWVVALMWAGVAASGAAWSLRPSDLGLAALAATAAAVLAARALRRRFGALGDDALAALRQGTEIAVYLGLLAALGRG